MGRLPDYARLLAIGLLNYSDDHGYFWANPLMVRGALFPFEEDSSKIRQALAHLAQIGYIRLGKVPDGRECGFVVKFDKYQRVDKAQQSVISPLAIFEDQSENDRGMIDDQSALEGKGKEGKGYIHTAPDGAVDEVGVLPPCQQMSANGKVAPRKTSGQIRVEKLFRRRESTPWDKSTLRAWNGAREAVGETAEEEWQLLEWFYALPYEGTYRRRDLATLLNNWSAEIDRARNFKLTHPSANPTQLKADMETPPDHWRDRAATRFPSADFTGKEWGDLSHAIRKDIIETVLPVS